MQRLVLIGIVVLQQIFLNAALGEAKPATQQATAFPPYAASIQSRIGPCATPDVCRTDAQGSTGTASATAVYSSTDGTAKTVRLREAFQDFFAVSKARRLMVTATIDIDQADAGTAFAGGGASSSRIYADVMTWEPQGWTFVSPVTVFAESNDGTTHSAPAGIVTLTFTVQLPYGTTGSIGVEVDFYQSVTVDSTAGGTATATASFAATLQSISITY